MYICDHWSDKIDDRDVLLKMNYSVDPLPTCLDYLKTKDESDRNIFHVATSEFVKVGQIIHNQNCKLIF